MKLEIEIRDKSLSSEIDAVAVSLIEDAATTILQNLRNERRQLRNVTGCGPTSRVLMPYQPTGDKDTNTPSVTVG